MTGLNSYSLLGALVMLVIGVIDLALVQKLVYPRLRWRFEQAKTTQTQGLDPNRFMLMMRTISLVILPLIGLMFLGGPLQAMFG